MKKENKSKNEEIKERKKECEKVFTNDGSNNIMKENYNLLDEDYRKFYEREGLVMKNTNDVVSNKKMNKLIICKEDFEKYFKGRKIINKKEYQKYLKIKNKIN